MEAVLLGLENSVDRLETNSWSTNLGDEILQLTTIALRYGLKGNRTVGTQKNNFRGVIKAMLKAYPLLLSINSNIHDEILNSNSNIDQESERLLLKNWLQCALHDGKLSVFVSNLGSQPQISSAYMKQQSIVRDSGMCKRFIELLQRMEVLGRVPAVEYASNANNAKILDTVDEEGEDEGDNNKQNQLQSQNLNENEGKQNLNLELNGHLDEDLLQTQDKNQVQISEDQFNLNSNQKIDVDNDIGSVDVEVEYQQTISEPISIQFIYQQNSEIIRIQITYNNNLPKPPNLNTHQIDVGTAIRNSFTQWTKNFSKKQYTPDNNSSIDEQKELKEPINPELADHDSEVLNEQEGHRIASKIQALAQWLNRCDQTLDDECIELLDLCDSIYAALTHGFLPQSANAAEAVGGDWRRKIQGVLFLKQTSVWEFFQAMDKQSGELGVESVQNLRGVKGGDANKLRLWIRGALNQGEVSQRIRVLLKLNPDLLEKNYEQWALLRQGEWIDYVVVSLEKIKKVTCNLKVEHLFQNRQESDLILQSDQINTIQQSQNYSTEEGHQQQPKLAVITTENQQNSASFFSTGTAFSPLSSVFDIEPPLSMGAIEKVEQQIVEGENIEIEEGQNIQDNEKISETEIFQGENSIIQQQKQQDTVNSSDLMFVMPLPVEEEKTEDENSQGEENLDEEGSETDDILAVLNIIESGKNTMRVRRTAPVPKPQRQQSFSEEQKKFLSQELISEANQQNQSEIQQATNSEQETEISFENQDDQQNNVRILEVDEPRSASHQLVSQIFDKVVNQNKTDEEKIDPQITVDMEVTGLEDHPVVLCLHVPYHHRRAKTTEIKIIEDYYQSAPPISNFGFQDLQNDGVLIVPQTNEDFLPPLQKQQLLPLSNVKVVSARTVKKFDGEYTNYVIVVTAGDQRKWKVEHRFSEFIQLRSDLKSYYSGLSSNLNSLPLSWDDMSKARSVFGQLKFSSEVVESRRVMLQKCMQDLFDFFPELQRSRFLLQFLAPKTKFGAEFELIDEWEQAIKFFRSSPPVSSIDENSSIEGGISATQGWRARGRIRLILKYPLELPTNPELFQLQEGKCASCGCLLPPIEEKNPSFFSWSTTNYSYGPRQCEYLIALYCHDCHHNETDRIPAHIVHKWDFTRKSVSGLAHEYLQSIYAQPIISVEDMNPGLLARVSALARAHELRKQASNALKLAAENGDDGRSEAFLKTLGDKRYLVDNPNYYSVRDLTDIAKGAFAELPDWLEGVNRKCRNIAARAVLRKKQGSQSQ